MLQCRMQLGPCWLATQISESVEIFTGKQMTCLLKIHFLLKVRKFLLKLQSTGICQQTLSVVTAFLLLYPLLP